MVFKKEEIGESFEWKCVTHSEEETLKVGAKLGRILSNGDVVLLAGELGAGKTTFVRGIASGMSIKDRVKSPTFTIVREYDKRLYHVDLYRINDGLFYDIEDYLYSTGVVVVEWGERLQNHIFKDYIFVEIRYLSASDREIKIGVRCFGKDCELLHRIRSGFGG